MNRISKSLKYLLVAISAVFIGVYVILVFFRIRYPFELEWCEGSVVDHVTRILSGQKLYVKPTLDFVPHVYTPLYYYLCASLSPVLGTGFMPLRLVSFASSLASFYIIYRIVKRETADTFSGFLAASLFAATYRISGAWFDIARVDTLFLFFTLVAVYLVRFKQSWDSYVLAGIFIALSFLTKQTALVIWMPIALYCIYADWRLAAFLIGTAGAIIGGSTVLLDWIHQGWYVFYVFRVSAQRPLIRSMFANFWIKDIFLALPVACLMSLLYVRGGIRGERRKTLLFYLSMSAGMLMGSWISRVRQGGYDNVLIPAYAGMAILFGLGVNSFLEATLHMPPRTRKIAEIAVYVCCIGQFAHLYYNPIRQVPTSEDLQAGWSLVRMMESVKGEVFLPSHGYLPVLAKKKPYAHIGAIRAVMVGPDGPAKSDLIREMTNAVVNKKFALILADSGDFFGGDPASAGYCVRREPVFSNDSVFWPVTGFRTRPEVMIYDCSKNP